MNDGYNWIRAKDCNGLVEMEKGKLKREIISEILKEIKACKCGIGYNEYKIDDLIEKLEGKLK